MVFIKPCTPLEVDFYQSIQSEHPVFASIIPEFLGTLQLQPNETTQGLSKTIKSLEAGLNTQTADQLNERGGNAVDDAAGPGRRALLPLPSPMFGKKIETSVAIVLSNLVGGFKKPNILDVKLGAQLWDESAPLQKRMRLDTVAAATTSKSMGFRIAGMRVWQGHENGGANGHSVSEAESSGDRGNVRSYDQATGYSVYNKFYGRQLTADNVFDGFRNFLCVKSAGISKDLALSLSERFLNEVTRIQDVLETEEVRMHSVSLLFVYEGDAAALQEALIEESNVATTAARSDEEELDVDDEDGTDEDEGGRPRSCSLKLIDFAHSAWTPGQGPDENTLQGIRSVSSILKELNSQLKCEKPA